MSTHWIIIPYVIYNTQTFLSFSKEYHIWCLYTFWLDAKIYFNWVMNMRFPKYYKTNCETIPKKKKIVYILLVFIYYYKAWPHWKMNALIFWLHKNLFSYSNYLFKLASTSRANITAQNFLVLEYWRFLLNTLDEIVFSCNNYIHILSDIDILFYTNAIPNDGWYDSTSEYIS